jgi:HlyD family secretion protein
LKRGKAVRKFIYILIIFAVLAGGLFLLRQCNQASGNGQSKYETLTLQRGDITAIVGATGTVRSNQTTILPWQISGRVGTISVVIGDLVNQNDVLAELDPSSIPQNLILAKADLINARRALDNLTNSQTAQAQVALALVQAQKAVQDAQALVDARQSNLDAAQANYILAQDKFELAEDAFNQVKDYAADNITRASYLTKLEAARQARDRALATLNWLQNPPAQPGVDEAQAALDLANARLADAQREWDRLKNGPDPDDIAAAQARIDALESSLASVNLKAPFTGTVTDVRSKPGDLVNPGTISFRLDDFSHYLVDVQISEVDINRIQLNQPANLTFDAVPNNDYTGVVVQVAAVGNVVGGVVYFNVTVELQNPDENIHPAMTAGVNIEVDKVTNVLLIPNRAVRLKDGKRVVYLLVDNNPTPVEVTIGVSSDTYSELLSGNVKEGDTIILNPSTDLLNIKPSTSFMR